MTAKYSNAPSLVPEANFTQSGAVNITAAPASFSSGRHHLHNETLPRQQSPNKSVMGGGYRGGLLTCTERSAANVHAVTQTKKNAC